MKKSTCLLLVLLSVVSNVLFVPKLLGQDKEYTLIGSLKMETGETFPYKIEFREENGNIEGFSYTYAPPRETKSAIMGVVDAYDKKLIFKEVEIISAHVVRTKAYMCLVNANLKYSKNYRETTLAGEVTNRQTDNTACTPGVLTFNNPEELLPIFEPKEQFDTVISMKKRDPREKHTGIKVAVEETPKPKPAVAEQEKITAGIEKTYTWVSDSIVLRIWDGGGTDGDVVSVKYNDEVKLAHHSLSKATKKLVFSVQAYSENTIEIIAESEGSSPPNTATLAPYDGKTEYSVLAYNTAGKSSIIRIRKGK